MLKSYGWGGVGGWVAYVIIVSAQVPLVLTLGLWTSGLGLTTRVTLDTRAPSTSSRAHLLIH